MKRWCGRYSGSSITCGWTWVPKDTSTLAISAYIRCKKWICRKVNGQNNCIIYVWPAFWSTYTFYFYYFDINLFLIDDACCKLYNMWLFPCENNSRGINMLEFHIGGKYCCSYYSRQGGRWQFEIVINADCFY